MVISASFEGRGVGERIWGSHELLAPPPEGPIQGGNIDPVLRDEVCARYSESDGKVLRVLFDHITHISHEEFLARLTEVALPVKDLIRNSVVLVEPQKSQMWVAQLVKSLLGSSAGAYMRLGDRFYTPQILINAIREYREKEDHDGSVDPLLENFFLFDDGLFSGEQMSQNIVFVAKTVEEETGIKPHVHVVVPYTSRIGRERVEKLAREHGIQVTIYSSQPIRTVAEVVHSLTAEDRAAMGADTIEAVEEIVSECLWRGEEKLVELEHMSGERKLDTSTLHFYSHKTPDGLSVPQVISEGINTAVPPYKDSRSLASLVDCLAQSKPNFDDEGGL